MSFFALILPLLQGPPTVPEDVIVTTKGQKCEGIIIFENDKTLLLAQGSKIKDFDRDTIASATGPRASYSAYIEKLEWVYAPAATSKDAVSLALWCKREGLWRDAEMHYWQALVKDPSNATAHQALGHRLQGEDWQAPIDDSMWRSMEDLDAWHMEQGNPWLFYSAHFEVQANAKLADALRAVAHLELLYARFYDVLQEMGGFYELTQPIVVRIYANRKSGYPEVGPNTHGYFDRKQEILNTWFENGRAKNLVRLACHALQFRAVTERARARPEDYPGWLNEGIATHFESSFSDNDGLSDFYFERIHLDWLRLHQQAEKPLSLDEILNQSITGIGEGKDAQLAFAQSYTLFYFLLYNEEMPTLRGFKDYLTGIFNGKSGSSFFKKSMKKNTFNDLEQKWTDFVEKSVQRDQKK